jgi:hypothetical protein
MMMKAATTPITATAMSHPHHTHNNNDDFADDAEDFCHDEDPVGAKSVNHNAGKAGPVASPLLEEDDDEYYPHHSSSSGISSSSKNEQQQQPQPDQMAAVTVPRTPAASSSLNGTMAEILAAASKAKALQEAASLAANFAKVALLTTTAGGQQQQSQQEHQGTEVATAGAAGGSSMVAPSSYATLYHLYALTQGETKPNSKASSAPTVSGVSQSPTSSSSSSSSIATTPAKTGQKGEKKRSSSTATAANKKRARPAMAKRELLVVPEQLFTISQHDSSISFDPDMINIAHKTFEKALNIIVFQLQKHFPRQHLTIKRGNDRWSWTFLNAGSFEQTDIGTLVAAQPQKPNTLFFPSTKTSRVDEDLHAIKGYVFETNRPLFVEFRVFASMTRKQLVYTVEQPFYDVFLDEEAKVSLAARPLLGDCNKLVSDIVAKLREVNAVRFG